MKGRNTHSHTHTLYGGLNALHFVALIYTNVFFFVYFIRCHHIPMQFINFDYLIIDVVPFHSLFFRSFFFKNIIGFFMVDCSIKCAGAKEHSHRNIDEGEYDVWREFRIRIERWKRNEWTYGKTCSTIQWIHLHKQIEPFQCITQARAQAQTLCLYSKRTHASTHSGAHTFL